MASSSHALAIRFFTALVATSALSLAGGCAAYNKVMGAVIRNSDAVEGHVQATNTMSVAVCKITLSPHEGDPRGKNDLRGGVLGPGQSAQVNIPVIGDPMDLEAPQPETWDIAVYGCGYDIHGDAEPGAELVSYSAMPLQNDGTLTIR